MTDSSACGFCGAPDSGKHSLVECTVSRCSWALVDDELAQTLVTITEPNAKHWLFTLRDSLSYDLFVKLAVTLWAIWSARRKVIHEGIFQSHQRTHSFITRFIAELDIINVKQPVPGSGRLAAPGTSNPRLKAPP
jgi:hypothetical protein